uniref:Fibrinogen C-terminal domain-containing protein n=1 Tax=Anopheles albimanus TaxID=7167 RepID=A0A182F4F8_ANOAL
MTLNPGRHHFAPAYYTERFIKVDQRWRRARVLAGGNYVLTQNEVDSQSDQTNDQLKDLQLQLLHFKNTVEKLNAEIDYIKTKLLPTPTCKKPISHCGEADPRVSSVYALQLCSTPTQEVYCNQTFLNGGWLVVYHRNNGIESNFNRSWESYKHGFGNPEGEHFIGLQHLHTLTYGANYEVAFLLMRDGVENTVIYDEFSIGSELEEYRIKRIGKPMGSMRLFHTDQSYYFHTTDRNHLPPVARATMAAEGCAFWFIDSTNSHDQTGFEQFCQDLKNLKIMVRKNNIDLPKDQMFD